MVNHIYDKYDFKSWIVVLQEMHVVRVLSIFNFTINTCELHLESKLRFRKNLDDAVAPVIMEYNTFCRSGNLLGGFIIIRILLRDLVGLNMF